MACIPPTLEGWVYIVPTHGPLDGPLYTWAQYTPTLWAKTKSGQWVSWATTRAMARVALVAGPPLMKAIAGWKNALVLTCPLFRCIKFWV